MLVGILEKSSRVRIARISLGFVFDMLSPVARSASWGTDLLLGSRPSKNVPAWSHHPLKGETTASAAFLIGLYVRLFRCSLSSQRSHLKRVVQKPQRSILRGGNLGRTVALHTQGKLCYNSHIAWTNENSGAGLKTVTCHENALFARDGESALRDSLRS